MKKSKPNVADASGEKKRIHLLDLLRGCAVTAMVLYHMTYTFGEMFAFPFFAKLLGATQNISLSLRL